MSIMRRTVLLAVLVLVGGVQILFSNVVHIPGIQARKRVDPPMLVVHPQELAIDSPKFDPLDSPTCRTTYDDVMLKWVVLLREKEEQRFPFLQSVARGDLLKLSPTTTVNTLFGALRGNKTPGMMSAVVAAQHSKVVFRMRSATCSDVCLRGLV